MSGPTAALLWAACRADPDKTGLAEALAGGADLGLAADVAIAQRVSPLLHRALEMVGASGDTEPWAVTLRRDAARCHAQSRLVLPNFGRLALEPLARAGLQPLVFKGLALVDRYPDPGLRPMGDVDLILPPEDIPRAVEVLAGEGWDVRPTPKGRPHEIDLVHPSLPGLPIDLHYALATWRDRTTRFSSTQLWDERRPATLQGSPAFSLPREQELLALVVHAAKPFHTFDRLIWSVDIAIVIGGADARAGMNWDLVAEGAGRASCATALAVALTHAARLGAPSPGHLRHIGARGVRAAALETVLSPEWPLMARERSTRMLKYALVDRWGPRGLVLLSDLTGKGPSRTPRRAVELPVRAARRWWRLRRRPRGDSRSGEKPGNCLLP